MSTPWVLSRLYSLDSSSTDFLRHLHSLIRHDEEEQYLTNLQGLELARLVDFLDETLSAIPADDDVSRQCLQKLQAICGHCATLPHSCIVADDLARVGNHPTTLGGIADIWEGIYRHKRVSIRSLKVPLDDDQTLKKSFFKEAVIWKRLKHPNIVPFIGVMTGPLEVVSEWMSNGTLVEFVEKNPGAKRISLLLDVAEGLNYLHANHAAHGDLKWPNILVDHDGHARLTGFEFPSIVRGMGPATQENGYTVAWATPEVLEGADAITREADVFAFGTVVTEVFMGRHATPVITSGVMGGEWSARLQEAQEIGLTTSVWEMTVRCWHRDPAQRPTMTEVVRIVRECYRMAATWRTGFTDIPAKVLINNILPLCEVKDVLSFGCTNNFFALIASDEAFWKRKLAVDYNFTGLGTARTSDRKFIYQRLRNPRVFVWGEGDMGQLGLPQFPNTKPSRVPFPVELHLPGVRVVSLATSQAALHALGADGSVYVWGTLGPFDKFDNGAGFSRFYTTAWTPLKLRLPAPTRAISCGDLHAMTLDANSAVWIFRDWGRPFRPVSPSLDCSSPGTTPIQIECGWQFSAVLTGSGDVYMWWLYESTFMDRYWKGMASLDKYKSTKAIVPDGGTVIPCHTWEINVDPVKLPVLPDLPDLPATGLPEEERRKETKLIKIAALSHCLVGLTNKGHVLKIDELTDEDAIPIWSYVGESTRTMWHPFLNYNAQLPYYSEIDKVMEHSAFHMTTGDDDQGRLPQVEWSPDTMLITHVSAHGNIFFAYSSSMVLKGESETTPEMLPIIIPELQNRSVISVVHGSNHFGALTSSGKLLTWGRDFKGALGLGSELPASTVTAPSEVRFNHGLEGKGPGVERYCFAVTASRHHTAALVVDVEGGEAPPGELGQYFETAAPRPSNNPNSRTRTSIRKPVKSLLMAFDRKSCCLM